jgi:uncharacterized protein (TIGR00369 family)
LTEPSPAAALGDAMPFVAFLGIELIHADRDEVRGRLEWAPERCTIGGLMHGGAVMSLADTCGGACAFLNLPDGAVGTAMIELPAKLMGPSHGVASARGVQRGPQTIEVRGSEDDPIAGGDVDEIQVDIGPGDPAGQVCEDARTVLDIDHDDFALARDREVRDRQRMPSGLGVLDEDVQLGSLA